MTKKAAQKEEFMKKKLTASVLAVASVLSMSTGMGIIGLYVSVMAIASDFLQSLVPISQFNKGQAAKIFDRLRSEKELIVLKNNQPSAIILSPEEYTRLTEIEEDYFLLLEANKRLDDNGNKEAVSYDSVMKHLGISEAELLEAEDADIE